MKGEKTEKLTKKRAVTRKRKRTENEKKPSEREKEREREGLGSFTRNDGGLVGVDTKALRNEEKRKRPRKKKEDQISLLS